MGAWVTARVVPPAVGLGGAGLLVTGVPGCESALGLNPGLLVSAVGGVIGVSCSDENEISLVRVGVGGPDGGLGRDTGVVGLCVAAPGTLTPTALLAGAWRLSPSL